MADGRGGDWVAAQLALFAAIGLAPRRVAGLPEWPEGLRRPAAFVGAALIVAGVLIGGAAARELGSNLTIFPKPKADGELVQSGVYGVVRHPIYSGVLLCALGYALLRAGSLALLLCIVLWVFFERKAGREERWLLTQFPEYDAYRRRVPNAIVPLQRPAQNE